MTSELESQPLLIGSLISLPKSVNSRPTFFLLCKIPPLNGGHRAWWKVLQLWHSCILGTISLWPFFSQTCTEYPVGAWHYSRLIHLLGEVGTNFLMS